MAILSFAQRAELASNAPTSVLQAVAQGNPPPEPYASATDLIGQLTAGAELGIRNRFTQEKAVQDQKMAQAQKNAELGIPAPPQPDILSQIVAQSQQASAPQMQAPEGATPQMQGPGPGMPPNVPNASYGGVVGLQEGGEAQGYADPVELPTMFRRQGLDYLLKELVGDLVGREDRSYEDYLADYDEAFGDVQMGVSPDWMGPGGVGRLTKLPGMVTKALKNPFAGAIRNPLSGIKSVLGPRGGGTVVTGGRGVQPGMEVVVRPRPVPAGIPSGGPLAGRTPGTALVPTGPGTAVARIPSQATPSWLDKLRNLDPRVGVPAGLAALLGLTSSTGDLEDTGPPADPFTSDDAQRLKDLQDALARIQRMQNTFPGSDADDTSLADILGPMQSRSDAALAEYRSGLQAMGERMTAETAEDAVYKEQAGDFVDMLSGFVTSPEEIKRDATNIALDRFAQALSQSQSGRRGSVTAGMEGTLDAMIAQEDAADRKNLELKQMMASTNMGIAERDAARSHAADTVMAPFLQAQLTESGANFRTAMDANLRLMAARIGAKADAQWSPQELTAAWQLANNVAMQTMGLEQVPSGDDRTQLDDYNMIFEQILENMLSSQGVNAGIAGLAGAPDHDTSQIQERIQELIARRDANELIARQNEF